MKSENKILRARVIATGELINVYKMKDGNFNIYLGEELNLAKVDAREHTRVFKREDLEILS